MAQPALNIPADFEDSYRAFRQYPVTLMYVRSIADPSLVGYYEQRLRDLNTNLFIDDPTEYNIPTLDYNAIIQAFDHNEVRNDNMLKTWIGDGTVYPPYQPAPAAAGQPPVAIRLTKSDPRCRFIFLSAWGGKSLNPLKLSQDMFTRIMTFHQVMPEFLDFVSVFGTADNSRSLRFSAFKQQSTLSSTLALTGMGDLRRSVERYQLCYNLRAVSRRRDPANMWGINMRPLQAAFHHQFDVHTSHALWIIAKGDLAMRQRINSKMSELRYGTAVECFKSSLDVHLIHCRWATEGWTWYLQWWEDKLQNEVKTAMEDKKIHHLDITTGDLEVAQYFEKSTTEAAMILELNSNIIRCIQSFYNGIITLRRCRVGKNPLGAVTPVNPAPPQPPDDFAHQDCKAAVETFSSELQIMIDDFERELSRARILVQEATECKTLVERELQAQSSHRMNDLAEQTFRLGRLTRKDSVMMKIITVVTLVYLPATFVSTFFGTDVIKYQDEGGNSTAPTPNPSGPRKPFGGSFSKVALDRWLQVTLPLTFLTLAVSVFSYYKLKAREA